MRGGQESQTGKGESKPGCVIQLTLHCSVLTPNAHTETLYNMQLRASLLGGGDEEAHIPWLPTTLGGPRPRGHGPLLTLAEQAGSH